MSRLFLVVLLAAISRPFEGFAADRGERERAFVRALEQFDAAKSPDDCHETARTLESILSDGFRSGAVYYNLGNAYYRAGDFGKAILNYRKAKPLRPRDPYLAANLEQALAAAPGRLTAPPSPWWRHVLFWTDWLAFPAKVRLFFGASVFAALACLTAFALRWPRLQMATCVSLLLAAALGIDALWSDNDLIGVAHGVITGETIARKGTGNSYEPAFDQPLRDGAEFQVLTQTADWTFGHFESIGDGWVRNEFVAR